MYGGSKGNKMKKKHKILIIMIVISSLIVSLLIGGKIYMDKQHEEKVYLYETKIAESERKSYSNISKIRFISTTKKIIGIPTLWNTEGWIEFEGEKTKFGFSYSFDNIEDIESDNSLAGYTFKNMEEGALFDSIKKKGSSDSVKVEFSNGKVEEIEK